MPWATTELGRSGAVCLRLDESGDWESYEDDIIVGVLLTKTFSISDGL